ncbi:hypothetical protein [Aestuariibacter salexigens]|uniref:hypothetical protein n=1 Tax=Aestuariibacter salexigens TaxID=226010 RepID=UPI000478753A|nr:hypothetical protein [Aestuariibacter salexigens]
MELYLLGVAACFVMFYVKRISETAIQRIGGVYTYYQNLRKVSPYLGDGHSFFVRHLKIMLLNILVSLTSWLGVLFFLYGILSALFDPISVKREFLTEESKKWAMPLLNNPHLSAEEACAYKCMLDIANGYKPDDLGEDVYACEKELTDVHFGKRVFDGSIALNEIQRLGFFSKEEMTSFRNQYNDVKRYQN